jgi:hypothetical protein
MARAAAGKFGDWRSSRRQLESGGSGGFDQNQSVWPEPVLFPIVFDELMFAKRGWRAL